MRLTNLLPTLIQLSTLTPHLRAVYVQQHALLAPPTNPLTYTYTSNMTTTSPNLAPVIALSHGGGPMPILNDPKHASIIQSLRTRVPQILKLDTPSQPRAIVLVTAHWCEDKPTVSSGEKHDLYYDYYNFPPETYKLKYDAPGSPEVAREVERVMGEVGLEVVLDGERGWDHGVFIPMMLIHPSATIPIIQLSVLSSEDPTAHYRMGTALHALRSQKIAIIGSGFASFHNMRLWGQTRNPEFRKRNDAWSDAVGEAIGEPDAGKREERLSRWREFPGAYEMHPRGGAEHFLPLVVCAGAAGEGSAKMYKDEFNGFDMFSYYWE